MNVIHINTFDYTVKINNVNFQNSGLLVIDNKLYFRYVNDSSLNPTMIYGYQGFLDMDRQVNMNECKEKIVNIESCRLIPLNDTDVDIDEEDIYRVFSGIPINEGEVYPYKDYHVKFRNIIVSKKGPCFITSSTSFRQSDTIFKAGITYDNILERIGGFKKAFDEIYQNLLLPRMMSPELLKRMGSKLNKGAILDGPSGCGKTLFARILKDVMNIKLKSIKGPEIMSKYIGESEENIRNIFNEIKSDKTNLYLLFIDEIDSIMSKRSDNDSSIASANNSIVNTFLTEIDGIDECFNYIIIGATNRYHVLDTAIIRPGRLNVRITIELPNDKEREEIINIGMKGIDVSFDMKKLVKLSKNFTGAEIIESCSSIFKKSMSKLYNPKKLDLVIKEITIDKKDIYDSFTEISPKYGRKYEEVIYEKNELVDKVLKELINEKNKPKVIFINKDDNIFHGIMNEFDGNGRMVKFNDSLMEIYEILLHSEKSIIYIPSLEIYIGYHEPFGITKLNEYNTLLGILNEHIANELYVIIGINDRSIMGKMETDNFIFLSI